MKKVMLFAILSTISTTIFFQDTTCNVFLGNSPLEFNFKTDECIDLSYNIR